MGTTQASRLDDSRSRSRLEAVDRFEALVALHQRDVLRLCYAVCGDQDRARDAAQRTWLAAWRGIGALRDPARARAWLVAIALREARREMREHRRRSVREVAVTAIDLDVVDRSIAKGALTPDVDLARALARLDPEDRALVTLRYVLGFDSFEIGAMTGRSASGTRARLARLLARMREELGDA
jgi:RNA polymerase sigma-70 factor (ECF subfamily)